MATLFDYPIDGTINDQGHLVTLFGIDAFKNALSCWAASFKGEIIRDPLAGGILTGILMKEVSDDGADELKSTITSELRTNFEPTVQILDISVTANIDEDRYDVVLVGYVPELKQFFDYYDSFGRLG